MARWREEGQLNQAELIRKFPGLTRKHIEEYFPEPKVVKNIHQPGGYIYYYWEEECAKIIEENEELQLAMRKNINRRKRRENKINNIVEFLAQFTPEKIYENIPETKRKYILHIGPTNSGKTYQSVERLKKAEKGVYLGPLRLLAMEMFDKLNADDCPCTLLTGEERIDIPFSTVTASTIEMLDIDESYDIAVIDEAQMLDDKDRGCHWFRAICLIDAEEVHICLAPEAENLIRGILSNFCVDEDIEIIRHERLAPLEVDGPVYTINDIQAGDALIAFSRKEVLSIAGHLEKEGIKTSVIYGSLPPDARRREVKKYTDGETSVVVATDAIGMGVSLPIKRIVFTDMNKFDGVSRRDLTQTEILQIAGRAGRYGMFDVGEVTSISEKRWRKLLKSTIGSTPSDLERIRIPFPAREVINSEYTLKEAMTIWQECHLADSYSKQDMAQPLLLLTLLIRYKVKCDKELCYRLITCPFDAGSEDLISYWYSCVVAIINSKKVPQPQFGDKTLEECELQYKALDLYHHLSSRFGFVDTLDAERYRILDKIAEYVGKSKQKHIRKCAECGRPLPLFFHYRICEDCYSLRQSYYGYDDYW